MALDYTEFANFAKGVVELQKQHEQFIRKFLLEMGLRMLGQTVKLTPVDTGALKGAWELSDVFRKGDELYIVLTNRMEYASFVEDGHMQYNRWVPGKWKGNTFEFDPKAKTGMRLRTKWIPGQHMARISITKVELELPKRYEKAFKQFCKDLGVGE